MRIAASLDFWSDGVVCFCHEALARALNEAFADVAINSLDRAYEKYRQVADQPALEPSAWNEFLRNGPRYSFTMGSGVTGKFSRYTLEFDVPEALAAVEAEKIRQFLRELKVSRELTMETEEQSEHNK